MTRDEAREAIKVLQHYADGGDVEYRSSLADRWWLASAPVFDFTKRQYRIKPKPAEGWGTISDDGDCPLMYSSEEDARRSVACRRHVFRWREAEQ